MVTKQHTHIIYTSLDELPIFNFDKAIHGDLRYLVQGYERGELEITQDIKDAWNALYNKHIELRGDNGTVAHYALILEIEYIKTQLTIAPALVNELAKGKPKAVKQEYLKELSAWGFPIDGNKPLKDEIQKINNVLRAKKSLLTVKESELEAEKKGEGKALTLTQQKAKLKIALKIEIDLKTTTHTEWFTYVDELKNLSKKHG